MSKTENAISQMEKWAADNSHGYDQANRWGPDYDCSSAVISAWELAGVPVKAKGATYTGNMRGVFLRCGFEDITSKVNLSTGSGLKRGDVLLNVVHHTAMYCGDGKEVEASINERGTTTGGMTGDQTGGEFKVRSYRNYPWDCVLRYSEEGEDSNVPAKTEGGGCKVDLPILRRGSKGNSVRALQLLLTGNGCSVGKYGVDGDFGGDTAAAVMRYQSKKGLTVDGIAGPATWSALLI